jgi:glycosyltransferase involved in cell wall biosynthesis
VTARLVAVVPAWNEEDAIGKVVEEIRLAVPGIDVVVVDDASTDRTVETAEASGATVLPLPFNVGIGGAVQTGFRYALAGGYDLAVRLDGDGQHDAREIGKILAPVLAGDADLVIGSRFVDGSGTYRPPFARRMGIRVFARLVSVLGRQRVTDTTSGFVALDRAGIELRTTTRRSRRRSSRCAAGCASRRCRSTCASGRPEPPRSPSSGRSTTSSR